MSGAKEPGGGSGVGSARRISSGPHHLGPHQLWLEEPEVAGISVHGDFTEQHAREFSRLMTEFGRGKPFLLIVVDVAGLGTVGASARKIIAEGGRDYPLRGAALYGASFATRVVATLVVNAMNLLARRDNPFVFFDDEAGARAWIETRRRKLLAAGGTG